MPLIKGFPKAALGWVRYIEDILRQMPYLKVMPKEILNTTKFQIILKQVQQL